jgi:hypothetical protein
VLPVNEEAVQWLRVIRLALIGRKIRVSETIKYPLDADGLRRAQRAKTTVSMLGITPDEAVTRELARASKIAIRFLRKRGVTLDDREDILQDALLWCLEHQDNYSLTTTLETWFINAVRDAYKRHQRHEARMVYTSKEVEHGIV